MLANGYNVANKPLDLFNEEFSQNSSAIIIKDFLSLDEISYLIECEKKFGDEFRHNIPGLKRVNHPWNREERELLEERLSNVLGRFSVWGGNYFISEMAYTPHVDLGRNLSSPTRKNVLLPLSIFPQEKKTYLVLFQQRYFGNSASLCAAPRKNPPKAGYNDRLLDYSYLKNFDPNHQIDPEIQATHLKHVKRGDLKGLSIEQIIPWEPGSCIIFDSTQVHCSSDFSFYWG